jgi:hypothetical protein
MSNYRKTEWAATVVGDTSNYEPQLTFEVLHQGLVLPPDAVRVICSVCGETPKFVGFGSGAAHWSCGCEHDCRDENGRETCKGCRP